jgi:hypothetical protein
VNNKSEIVISSERVENVILRIRREKVILDADLAELYGVKTKRLNEQVKRNKDRFPEDFMFQLTEDEKNEVVANCDHLSQLRVGLIDNIREEHFGTHIAVFKGKEIRKTIHKNEW